MPSSDKFPDWSVFKERKLPETLNLEIISPEIEMSILLRQYSNDAKKAREGVKESYYEGVNIAAKQAVYIVQLGAALEDYEPVLKGASLQNIHRHLRIIKDQMLSALLQEGLEIIIPINKPFDEIADLVNVESWLHDEKFTSEMVAEVLEPIIYHKGSLIQMGRVVMGAPVNSVIE